MVRIVSVMSIPSRMVILKRFLMVVKVVHPCECGND